MTYFITIPNKYDYEPHPAGESRPCPDRSR